MKCRFCDTALHYEFIDLVNAPPSNSFLSQKQLNEPEAFYPLKLFVCDQCYLVQIDEYKSSNEIFSSDYAYFSSYSTSWLEHAKQYVVAAIDRFGLNPSSQVVEIASNDGYLLQYFLADKIPVLGIEPSSNVAEAARQKGIETLTEFFCKQLAMRLTEDSKTADLIIGNNVLAHVPDINDFVAGLKMLLKKDGTITMEFPYLMQLVKHNQFDTIYHEHFSYLSFHTVQRIFNSHGLILYNVDELTTHGGSLRIYARHSEDESKPITAAVHDLLDKEENAGMFEIDYYADFQKKADRVKNDLIDFLIDKKKNNQSVAAYGAAAKGNTLLNYCGIKKDLIEFVVDASPFKQGKFLPGSHIPVVAEEQLKTSKPQFIIVLPWNIKNEITDQLYYIRDWGAAFVAAVPHLECW